MPTFYDDVLAVARGASVASHLPNGTARLLERRADQQLAGCPGPGGSLELGADRQLALALLTLPGLPFAARHDSPLARLRSTPAKGILCFLACVHHVDHEPDEVLVAIRDR